ncbi:MAG TPA: gluconokinase [Bacteroidetes bacterium]|nr:gluconokinase [Bacteroidota bacterium]
MVDAPFYDADDFHPLSNINKMKQNIPLNDKDRLPWLATLSQKIEKWNNKGEAILACSALKEKYREILSSTTKNILWVFLKGNFELVQTRIEKRNDHFMSKELLRSQYDALEIPDNAITIDIELAPAEIIKIIMSKIKV